MYSLHLDCSKVFALFDIGPVCTLARDGPAPSPEDASASSSSILLGTLQGHLRSVMSFLTRILTFATRGGSSRSDSGRGSRRQPAGNIRKPPLYRSLPPRHSSHTSLEQATTGSDSDSDSGSRVCNGRGAGAEAGDSGTRGCRSGSVSSVNSRNSQGSRGECLLFQLGFLH